MSDGINYGKLMHQAMQALLRNLLADIAQTGLPGKHHFYITFDTAHKGVDMAQWLRDRHPGEMTIVMQDWYDNLAVMSDRFTVTLNFGNSPEPLVIPFAAIKTFVDPSVEFGLRFDAHDEDDDPEIVLVDDDDDDTDDDTPSGHDAQIVSLDKFRKH